MFYFIIFTEIIKDLNIFFKQQVLFTKVSCSNCSSCGENTHILADVNKIEILSFSGCVFLKDLS